MSVMQAALRSWDVPPVATFALLLTALVYLRGWWLLRRAGFPLLPPWRASAFLAGLLTLWIALASPMDVFNGFVLTAHMLQHMLLMMVAPPLVLLGAPLIPLVRGLPTFAAREFAGPFLNWSVAQRTGRWLTRPLTALLLMGIAMFAWHTPALYELALRSATWHQIEHACFVVTSLIFWWPVVQPWPSAAQWPRWAMVPYLLVADLQNTILSAILVFSDQVIYPSYLDAPRLFGFSAREDQAAAGAIMWVVGSIAFLVPAMLIAVECLSRKSTTPVPERLPKRIPMFTLDLRSRFGLRGQATEAISFVVLFVAVGLCLSFLLAANGGDDDDLALRAQQQSGALVLSAYAPEGDLEIGPTRVNVLVQNAATHEVLLDSQVGVSLASAKPETTPPAVQGSGTNSTNQLMQAVQFDVPEAGDWVLNLRVTRQGEAGNLILPLRAVIHERGADDWWPQAIFPSCGLLLLFVYLHRHRQPKSGHVARTASTP